MRADTSNSYPRAMGSHGRDRCDKSIDDGVVVFLPFVTQEHFIRYEETMRKAKLQSHLIVAKKKMIQATYHFMPNLSFTPDYLTAVLHATQSAA